MPTLPTTEKAIRDRMIDVMEALVARIDAGDRFVAYRNEDRADFIEHCQANAEASLRWFQVRTLGGHKPPAVTNTDIAELLVTFEIIVAYPQDGRFGDLQALGRDDAFELDKFQIDVATGMCARANFQPPNPDACWRASEIDDRLIGDGVDFLVMRHTLSYVRSLP